MFLRMLARAAVHRRGRAAAALLAMTVAAAAATAMLNLYVDVQAKLRGEFRKYGANVVVIAKDGGELPSDTLPRVKSLLGSRDIPVRLDPPRDRVIDHPLQAAGETVHITATSLGNPHCAVFMDAPPDDARLVRLGAVLESHAFFPQKTNVEFVSVRSRGEIRVRFWERGVGYTRASGTGSASAAVAAVIKGLADRKLRVVCDGGVLAVDWPEGGHVHQVGEVEMLFEGDWLAEGPR